MEQKSREFALKAAQFIEDKKGLDIRILEVGEITLLADYFLICSGTSHQHVQAIFDNLLEKLKEENFPLLGIEGYEEGRWVLLDYGALVIHIFMPEERKFYNLERLWGKAQVIDMIPSKGQSSC